MKKILIVWFACCFSLVGAALFAKDPAIPKTAVPVTSWKAGDIASENVLGFEKTAEIFATGPDGATIVGKDTGCEQKGVFVEGRTVHLDPFIISKFEVTQELYKEIMKDATFELYGEELYYHAMPSSAHGGGQYGEKLPAKEHQQLRPVDYLSWYDMICFCNLLSLRVGLEPAYKITIKNAQLDSNDDYSYENDITDADVELIPGANGYRLPTEAEWEFAARGGNPDSKEWNYAFSGAPNSKGTMESVKSDKNFDKIGWYSTNANKGRGTWGINLQYGEESHSHETGVKAANSLGIYDMSGNVFEFCWDWFAEIVPTSDGKVELNPTGPKNGTVKVLRGSSWGSAAYSVTDRLKDFETKGIIKNRSSSDLDVGFRLVRTVGKPDAKRNAPVLPKVNEKKSAWEPGSVAIESILGLKNTQMIHATTDYTVEIRGNLDEPENPYYPFNRMLKVDPFDISRHPVTREFYKTVMEGEVITIGETKYKMESDPRMYWYNEYSEENKYNVEECITIFDAMYFCNVLSKKMGREPVYEFSNYDMADDTGHIKDAAIKTNYGANGFRLMTRDEAELVNRFAYSKEKGWYVDTSITNDTKQNSFGVEIGYSQYYDLSNGAERDREYGFSFCLVCSTFSSKNTIQIKQESIKEQKQETKQATKKNSKKNSKQTTNQTNQQSAIQALPSKWKAGDIATETVLGLEKTREVFVLGMDDLTIQGDPQRNNKDYKEQSKVFYADSNIRLSPFIIGCYEVTNELYDTVMKNQKLVYNNNEYSFFYNSEDYFIFYTEKGNEKINLTPYNVYSVFDTCYFCNALSELCGLEKVYDINIKKIKIDRKTGKANIKEAEVLINKNANGYRIPTSAEWEVAARGGNPQSKEWNYIYTGTGKVEDLLDYVWCRDNTIEMSSKGYESIVIHETGLKKPDSLGLYDITGNVSEITLTIFNDRYNRKPQWLEKIKNVVDINPCIKSLRTNDRFVLERGNRNYFNKDDSYLLSLQELGSLCSGACCDVGLRLVRNARTVQPQDAAATEQTSKETSNTSAKKTSKTKKQTKTKNNKNVKPAFEQGAVAKENMLGLAKTSEIYATGTTSVSIDGNFEGRYSGCFEQLPVQITPFTIGQYMVTRELYKTVMLDQKLIMFDREYKLNDSPSKQVENEEADKYRPVENITLYDAIYFCNALSQKANLNNAYNIIVKAIDENGHITKADVSIIENSNGYRLPTACEWEFAARGGNPLSDAWNNLYAGALDKNDLENYAWFTYEGKTLNGCQPVGLKKSNSLGLYDMFGNLGEFTLSYYNEPSKKIIELDEDASIYMTAGGWNYSPGGFNITSHDGLSANYYQQKAIRLVRSITE